MWCDGERLSIIWGHSTTKMKASKHLIFLTAKIAKTAKIREDVLLKYIIFLKIDLIELTSSRIFAVFAIFAVKIISQFGINYRKV